ncbi:TPA: hypothetical protein U1C34_001974 [Streptococcus suis]|nr:hypothetical protein [Streptococcus suis]HEL2048563.1 hypothetical protein [Streptococcus suis]HEM2582195.1 hypothetical protein [Streptococcus suis]HEM3612090.1 hypothetical protein [Streptococcus suis]HEM3623157.1 hypothetical protein [Streptococcus suis]
MEVMMKTKILSLHNLIGFVTTPPGNLTLVDLLEQVYEMGNAFKVSLLDLAYTDGPVIFKSSLRSTEDLVIFTSIIMKLGEQLTKARPILLRIQIRR